MTISVSDVITKVSIVLQDTSNVRWPTSELIGWINDGAHAIINRKPNAGSVTTTFTMSAGYQQTLPSNIHKLLDVNSNVVDGSPVNRSDKKSWDQVLPSWRSLTPVNAITQFSYDHDIDPITFYNYPPINSGQSVELAWSIYPTAIVETTDTLNMRGEYEEALINFVLYRAFSKDSQYANGQFAILQYKAFQDALGMQQESAS